MRAMLPDYSVRYSPRAKNLRLRVTADEGLCVVVPMGFDESRIPALLSQKKMWLADAMKRIGETRRFLEPRPVRHLPESLRLVALGETWSVAYTESDRSGITLRAEAGTLTLSGRTLSPGPVMRKLKDWLRARVREELFPIAEQLATKHRLALRGLLVKSQRTRWASCSAKRNLSLNTKLLFLSPDLVNYALTHELCHTVYMNHSTDFWRLVASREPRYRALDQALREAWKTVPRWMF
jgi:predicted metal-dependent hydrolase